MSESGKEGEVLMRGEVESVNYMEELWLRYHVFPALGGTPNDKVYVKKGVLHLPNGVFVDVSGPGWLSRFKPLFDTHIEIVNGMTTRMILEEVGSPKLYDYPLLRALMDARLKVGSPAQSGGI